MNTSSGAEWAYFMDAFGPAPAFLFSWVSTLVLKPSQMAIICLSFAQYAVEAFVSECDPPLSVVKMVALLAVIMILFVNCYSVDLGMAVQNIFTAAKLVAVLIVICGGAYKLAQGNVQHLSNAFNNPAPSIGAVATAFYTGLWAYDGWNNLNYVTEEIQNPSKNLPRSIIIGIPLVTLCYALINISYLAAMSPTEMIESEAVASLIAAAMVLYGTIDSLIDFFSFTAWIFYGGSMVALLVMRYTKPNYPRPYKVPLIIPILVLVISGYLVAAPIIEKPQIEYLYAVLFILAGLIFYVPFVKMGLTPRFMEKVTLFFQLLLEVVPTSTMAMFE
uniref:Amino acid permease/ SLC12A domain-containing protein n=1 Tax=Megaselia scalaris TaxID=36166 RepID=T1H1U6_MEGSC